jgi:redox-sensitive bicupin YhaK (pirin superfamily)
VYVYGGAAVEVGGGHRAEGDAAPTCIDSEHMAILANDAQADGVRLAVPGSMTQAARVLLVAGRPLREPIAQHGPFVMNTVEQLRQAVVDFQRGVLAT